MSNISSDDPIVEQFMTVYGVRDLFESIDLQKITRMGDYLMAQCPFHDNQREPDFQMHKDLGLFNCFGCQVKGNLYQFFMMFYNITYREADGMIQKLAGFDGDSPIEDIRFRAKLRNMFRPESEDEAPKKGPALTEEVIAMFNTGPDPYNYLSSRGFSPETIAYFECTFTNQWRVWDQEKDSWRYEERIVVPGHLDDGTLKGFIGRTPIGDEPKYRYTAGYQKSLHLFNMHRAKRHSDDGLIAVEGPLDAIQVHNLGFPNVVAIYGASLSNEQLKLICKYTEKMYLAFDNDNAGREAMRKAVDMLKDIVEVYLVDLAPYKDPGEITDASDFQYRLDTAINWRYFLMNQFRFK